jgi:hypothetical protein
MGKLEMHGEELELVNGSLAGAWIAKGQSWERARQRAGAIFWQELDGGASISITS